MAELHRLIAEMEATSTAASKVATTRPKLEKLPPLTAEEEQVIQAYVVKHGSRWKSILNRVWMGGPPYDDGGTLRRLRNSHGPSWLHAYRLPKPRPEETTGSDHQPDAPETCSVGRRFRVQASPCNPKCRERLPGGRV
ncbi:SANT/Myb-like DNA-binding domain-containing protein [Ensifer sp. NPDC090286]|uniref:SANT/Myb-like DNA-binding domain-containing protein n=1 Tax=Ensifer sp. NPDC090286 TaxID=3363991 RepID=UPI00383B8684